MLRKRFYALLAMLVGMSMLLVACGETPTNTPVPVPTNTTAPPAAAPTDTTAPVTAPTNTTAPAAATSPTAAPVAIPSGVFSWRIYAEPETMDPALMQENLSIEMGQNLYDSLTQLDPTDLTVKPALASSWDVSPDGSVYTFHLRPDAKFSNGDPVTSADVLYSYNRAATTPNAPYLFVMEDMKGVTDIEASMASTDTTKAKITTISGLEAPDAQTVKITLNGPSAYFLAETTLWTYYVINKKQVDKGGEWWLGPGAGTSAYTLTEWKHNQSMSFAPNANFWGDPKPAVNVFVPIEQDTATAQAQFEQGTLSGLEPDPGDLDRIKKDATLSKELSKVGYARAVWVGLNVMQPPFGPLTDTKAMKLRQAFYMSIDRQQLVDLALAGSADPLTTLLPKGVPANQTFDPYPFNPDKAKQLMADAGYPNGQGLDLTYTYRQRDAEQHVAEQLQQQWQENLGIHVNVQGVVWADMLKARQAHQYTMFYGSWGQDYPDPQDWLFALFDSNQIQGVGTGTGNDPGYSNPLFDQAVRQANVMADPAKVPDRMKLYQQAEQQLLTDAPIVPLYQVTRYWLMSPKWTGFSINAQFIYPFRFVRAAGQ